LRRAWVTWVATGAGCLALACSHATRPGGAGAGAGNVAAAAVPHPTSPAENLKLAKAYYAAGRFADARRAAAATLAAQPKNDEAKIYLGLSYEGLQQFDSARALYTTMLAAQPNKSLRRQLNGRLALVARGEMVAAARQALARESLLAQTPPDPNTVAVMPFHFAGGDTTLKPLERGLAAVVVTDLSRVSTLHIVERARLQALLDEMKLTESGRVDPSTGARSGRLVRAAEVVQGQFSSGANTQVRIDATVVRATDAQVAATGSNADKLQALFDVEKAVVFQLLDHLHITLTPKERTAISERPTRDIQAFLLYSRGLEAEDRGDFAGAAAAFTAAAQRDPNFGAATQQASSTQAAQTASTTSASDLASSATATPGPETPASGALASAINGAIPSGATMLGAVSSSSTIALPATDPNRICEGATCDGPARAALVGTVIIIFKIP